MLFHSKSGDLKSFERTYSQLRPLYASVEESDAAATDRRQVVGLVLMHLLVEARLAEFHSEVEQLHGDADRLSPAIAFPLGLEASLMEGAYNKVLSARKGMPSPFYGFFMDKLTQTVRDDIADCAAASYSSLPIAAAQRLLMLDSAADTLAWVRSSKPDWVVAAGGVIQFAGTSGGRGRGGVEKLPVDALIANTLAYAADLERIV